MGQPLNCGASAGACRMNIATPHKLITPVAACRIMSAIAAYILCYVKLTKDAKIKSSLFFWLILHQIKLGDNVRMFEKGHPLGLNFEHSISYCVKIQTSLDIIDFLG